MLPFDTIKIKDFFINLYFDQKFNCYAKKQKY